MGDFPLLLFILSFAGEAGGALAFEVRVIARMT